MPIRVETAASGSSVRVNSRTDQVNSSEIGVEPDPSIGLEAETAREAFTELQSEINGVTPVKHTVLNQTSYTVTHDRNRKPDVWFIDNSGNELEVEVDHISENQFIVRFNQPQSGELIHN